MRTDGLTDRHKEGSRRYLRLCGGPSKEKKGNEKQEKVIKLESGGRIYKTGVKEKG